MGLQTAKNAADTAQSASSTLMRHLTPLWPLIAGLALGRAGLIVAAYGSYVRTDEGLFTDGSMLAALGILLVAFIAIAASKKIIPKRAVNIIAYVCIALEAASLLGTAFLDLAAIDGFTVRFWLCTLCTLASSGIIYYWLRRARGTNTTTAAVFVFAALILSELVLLVCSSLRPWVGNSIACALALLQYPCIMMARRRPQPYEIEAPTQTSDYFGFTKTMIQSKQFLTATAIGIGLLSIAIGLLRGYPNGEPIPFSPIMRLSYGALTIAMSAVIIALILHGKKRVMTVGIFITMEVLACLTLILYAAFPNTLDMGAVLVTTLNAMMVGFTWYIIIAFMSYGWRDPYYYAIAGWMVWLGCRSLARVNSIMLPPFFDDRALMIAIIGSLIVLSTQVVFMQLLTISKLSDDEDAEQQQGLLTKIMGLDNGGSLAGMRQAAIQHSAESIGKQFLLSGREVEVLALYAQGFTQKRVAQELYISQGTVHAHIKKIYGKTGFHSRQEILDYMENYTQ